MARRRLGVLWLSLLSLPGLGFFDFFAKPEEEDAPKGKVATASYSQLKILNALRKWNKADGRWKEYCKDTGFTDTSMPADQVQGFILMPENYKTDFLKSFTSHAKLPSLLVDADEDEMEFGGFMDSNRFGIVKSEKQLEAEQSKLATQVSDFIAGKPENAEVWEKFVLEENALDPDDEDSRAVRAEMASRSGLGRRKTALESFLDAVIHVENATRLDQVLGFLQQDLGLRSWLRQRSWEAHVPWIQDMFLSLWMQNASVNLTNVEELHFQFSGPAAARLSGAISPTLELTATTPVHLDKGTAKIKLRGYEIEISQDMPLSPVELQLQANFEVIAAGTAFVAYNGSGLQGLQFDQMQRASCASAYLVQNEGQPMQLLEARCAPQVRQLQVVLPHLDLGDLELEVLEVVQKFMQLIGVAFNQSVPEILDGYVSQRGRAAVNEMLQKSLSQSSACPASNFSSGELRAIDVPAGWTSVLLLAVTMVFLMVYLAWLLQLRKQERAVSHPEALEHGFLPQAPSLPPGRGLGWQPGVPCSLRWGMLCGIGGTTFLFVYASVTSGVLFSGSFEASKDGSSATKHMASLSMENSLVQTLQVGSYFVFAAMLIFSVIWPYIKLLTMVYVWAAPVDPKTRGPVLLFLDRIGKWSLMDNIILFLFISFFWIAWIGEDVVSGGSASFGLKCSPGIELNTFLAATILSLLLGHAMLWVHGWYCPDDGGSVSPTTCSRPDRHRLRILGLAQVVCILLTVLSWQLEVVDVAFGGLVGTFLKVTDQPTSKTYSIMGLLSRLGKQGSTYLQVTFAVFVLIIPLLYLLAMAFLCLYQLQPKKQQLVLRLCYTLNAWAAYDVFFIAFLAAVLGGERYGIGQFIELVVYQQNLAPMCDALRDIGVQCMHVQLALLPGALLILLAVVASFLVSLLATRELNKG